MEAKIAELEKAASPKHSPRGSPSGTVDARDHEEMVKNLELLVAEKNKLIENLNGKVAYLENQRSSQKAPEPDMSKWKQQIQELQHAIAEKENVISSQGMDINFLRSQLEQVQQGRAPTEYMDFEFLHREIEAKDQVIKKLEAAINMESAPILEKLEQEMQKLQDQLHEKQAEIEKYKNELEKKSQDNQSLAKIIKSLEKKQEGNQQLLLEIASCLNDVRSLKKFVDQYTSGNDPNVSVIVGFQKTDLSVTIDAVSSVEDGISQIKVDLATIQNLISSYYADHVGEGCVVQ